MRLILSGDPLPLPVPPPSTFYRSETCRAHKHNFFSFLQLPKRAQTRTSPSPEMGESNNWTPLSRRSKSKRRRRVCGTRSKSSASEALGSSGGTVTPPPLGEISYNKYLSSPWVGCLRWSVQFAAVVQMFFSETTGTKNPVQPLWLFW